MNHQPCQLRVLALLSASEANATADASCVKLDVGHPTTKRQAHARHDRPR